MPTVDLTEAESRLSSILDRVEAGETFVITRQGRAVARVSAAESGKKPIPFEELARFRASISSTSASGLLAEMRDEDW